jgi:plasmid stabilization system protein ParE
VKPLRILSPVEDELTAAALYYEQRSPGLGARLVDAADAALLEIPDNPLLCHEIDPGYRQKLLRRFPFAFVYRIDADEVVVVAFMHLRRRPGYWRDRLG